MSSNASIEGLDFIDIDSQKKSKGVKSHDLGGQLTGHRTRLTIGLLIRLLCGMWHRLVEATFHPTQVLAFWFKKV